MRNILITGVTSCESRGVEALVRSIAGELEAWPKVRIRVLTQTPALDAAALADTGVECAADPFVVSRSWSQMRPRDTPAVLARRRTSLVKWADAVVATGGDLHTADYGVSTPYLRALSAAQKGAVCTAMFGQSVGPFTDPADTQAFTDVASRCDLLTVREEVTHTYVTERLGIPARQVTLTADPAFVLRPATTHRTAEILASAGLTVGDQYICVAPSQGISRYSDITEANHLGALLRLVRELADYRQVPVLVIPHCHDSRPHNDDRLLATAISHTCSGQQVYALTGALNAADYKAVLAGADLVVSERLHAAIGALSSGVPAIAIGHSHKFHGVLAHTYGPHIPPSSFHIDVREFTQDPAAITRIVERTDGEMLRKALTARLPEVTTLARGDYKSLRTLLDV